MTGKIRFKVLLIKKSIFDLKHLRNHDKLINGLKKQKKKSPKKPNSSRNQKSTRAKMNFSHQIEQFDSNIVHFGGLNRCQ